MITIFLFYHLSTVLNSLFNRDLDFLESGHNTEEVYSKGSGVRISRYPVTVIGKSHLLRPLNYAFGKADGELPVSQETLVYGALRPFTFSGFED
jgi:hypothetical protein